MMKRFFVFLPAFILFSSLSFADEVVPATSDDVNKFDTQVKETKQKMNRHRVRAERKANFGKTVSTEEKTLKEEGLKSKFGKTVSEQAKNKSKAKAKGIKECLGDTCTQQAQTRTMDQVRERKRTHTGTGQDGSQGGQGGSQGQGGSGSGNGQGGSGRGHGR